MNKDSLFAFIKNPEIYKYITVGSINAILILTLTIIFTSVLGIFYVISAVISYELSIILGFFMHDKWTFVNVKKTSKMYVRLIKYNTFSLIGLGINASVLVILTDQVGLHYTIGESIAILIAFLFNYTMSKKISFRN